MNQQPPPPNNGPGNFGGPPMGGPPNGPGYGMYGQVPAAPINNNMVFVILTTLFCCLPFGIVAIINASKVNQKVAMGDYFGAQNSARLARTWSIVALSVGLVVAFIYIVFFVLIGALASTEY